MWPGWRGWRWAVNSLVGGRRRDRAVNTPHLAARDQTINHHYRCVHGFGVRQCSSGPPGPCGILHLHVSRRCRIKDGAVHGLLTSGRESGSGKEQRYSRHRCGGDEGDPVLLEELQRVGSEPLLELHAASSWCLSGPVAPRRIRRVP
jgi:hypothetical protein